jgi:2,4-dienoyl-CoA reductase (NADPH2)
VTTITKFPLLTRPGYIGRVKTRNRMIKTAAGTFFPSGDKEEPMNDKVKWFYESIARGGIGLLIVESPIIDYPIGARRKNRLRIDGDKYIDGLRELTEIIHKYGCPTFMQMNHDGPWQMKGFDPPGGSTYKPVAASPVSINSETDLHNDVPRELTIPEIEEIISKFASAAVRAQKAGFDGVDINASSSHLLHNFLSPFWNKRQDIYGGTLENSARFLVSIIKEIKSRLGKDFPVSVTINGIEIGRIIGFEDSQCLTADDAKGIARMVQAAGADAIMVRSLWLGKHISCFLPDTIFYPELPECSAPYSKKFDWSRWGAGAQVPLAASIKKVVSIPVIAVGRLDADLGEKVLREGKADFIGMTRRILADPDYPNKVAEGRLDDIAPCTACNTCLEENRRCRINAAHGSDEQYLIKPAEKKKKVLVVGGGPAGMEAARVLALRGHEVTLYEKTHKLGGMLPLASMVRELEIQDMMVLPRYLETQITKLGVNVRLGQDFDASFIERDKPDVVILATGGIHEVPDIPGINKSIVTDSADLQRKLNVYLKLMKPNTLRWLTKYWMPIGKRVVIIGVGKQGLELGVFLVKRHRKVTIVDTVEPFAGIRKSLMDKLLLSWFSKKEVPLITSVRSLEITNQGLNLVTKEGDKLTIEADSIIPTLPLKSNTALLKSLEGKVPEIYAVGDCYQAGLIADAIGSSWRIARKV